MAKFKVGDKVRCVEGYCDLLIEGKEYEVIAVPSFPNEENFYVSVNDERDREDGSWLESRFELVETTPTVSLRKNDRITDEAGNLGTVTANPDESGMVGVLFDKFGNSPLTATRMPVGKVTRVVDAKAPVGVIEDELLCAKPFEVDSGTMRLDNIPIQEFVGTNTPVSEIAEDTGSAATSKHYNSKLIQPIEIAQMVLTPEEFKGAMKFNIMKYTQRAGSKEGESSMKDWNKAIQYKLWLELAEKGVVIDPRKDVV